MGSTTERVRHREDREEGLEYMLLEALEEKKRKNYVEAISEEIIAEKLVNLIKKHLSTDSQI